MPSLLEAIWKLRPASHREAWPSRPESRAPGPRASRPQQASDEGSTRRPCSVVNTGGIRESTTECDGDVFPTFYFRHVIHSDRVRRLLEERGISQSELARRVRVTQGAIAKIVSNNPGGSSHLHKIARELGTTPEYLLGEIDDPGEDALPPPVEPRVQLIALPVALPALPALAAAFEAILVASPGLDQAELARELAKRLPTVLRIAGDTLPLLESPFADGAIEPAATPAAARRARRRA